jgi:hypothetical protein
MVKPVKVYLDQNIYGHMYESRKPWQHGEIAQAILEPRQAGIAEVWAGTANAVEVLQTSDPACRSALASMMLDLTDARRMWHGYSFEAVWEFMQLLHSILPGSVRFPQYFHFHAGATKRDFLGALGLLIATGTVNQELVEELEKDKLGNVLIHARLAVDPDHWIGDMIRSAETLETTASDPLVGIDKLTVDQINQEIESLKPNIHRLAKDNMGRLNKHRGKIAQAYGAIEVGACLASVFCLPCELDAVFDIPRIVAGWRDFQDRPGFPPLPRDITEAGPEGVPGLPDVAVRVLQQAIYGCAKATPPNSLYVPYLAYQVILREMQQCINDPETKLPTGGLTFDADHAAALLRFDVIICRDVKFAESCKTMANAVETWTKGRCAPEVVSNADQIRRAIKVAHRQINS